MSNFSHSEAAADAILTAYEIMHTLEMAVRRYLPMLRTEMSAKDKLHFTVDREIGTEEWKFETLVTHEQFNISARRI